MKATTNIFFTILFVLLDQFSKYIIRFLGGFYICNPGIAFGIKLHPTLFWVIWSIIIAITSFQILNFKFSILNQFSITKFSNFKLLGLIFILSGAISNIIDRLLHGCVFDFIDLKFWPIFNLADTFIVLGIILILIIDFKNLKFKI